MVTAVMAHSQKKTDPRQRLNYLPQQHLPNVRAHALVTRFLAAESGNGISKAKLASVSPPGPEDELLGSGG